MKGSNIVGAIHYMRMSKELMQDFIRERPNAVLARNFKGYCRRFDQIKNDLVSEPLMPRVVVDGINQEWNSDVPGVIDIQRKIHLLNPDQREFVEHVIDGFLKGEQMHIQLEEKKL